MLENTEGNTNSQEIQNTDEEDVHVYTSQTLEMFDVETIQLQNPKVIKTNNQKIFFCKLEDDLLIQTNNIKVVNDLYLHNGKQFINLSLDSEELSNKILEIDNKIILLIKENFKIWFNKSVSIESILEYFIPTKMYTNNLTTFFINEIPTYENEIDINIYDNNDNLIDNKNIPTIENSTNIIKLNGVYLEKNKFYCNWEIVQMKINEKNEN